MKRQDKHWIILGIFIILALIIRIYIIIQPAGELVTYNGDDMYYYLKIAENILEGKGVSFDGINTTNGFHPLYLLMILPFVKIFLLNKLLASYSALILLMLFNIFTVIFIYRIVVLLTKNKDAALISAFIWLFNPCNIFIPMTGVEVALSSFFIGASLYAYINFKIKGNNDFSKIRIWHIVILGILLGLAILSRSDSIFIAIAIGLDVIYNVFRKKNVFKNVGKSIGKIALLTLTTILTISPWIIWSRINTGLWVQGSGSALMYNSMNGIGLSGILYKIMFGGVFGLFKIFNYTVTAPFLALIIGLIIGSIISYRIKISKIFRNILIFLALALLVYAASLPEAVHYPAGLVVAVKLAIVSSLILLFGVIIGLNTKILSLKDKLNRKSIEDNLPVILGLLFMAGFYLLLFWHHQPWYFLSILLLLIILLGNAFDILLSKIKKFRIKKAALIIILVLSLLFIIRLTVLYNSSICPWQHDMYSGAIYLKENIPEDAKIGAFNAGIFSYFSDRTIVNLDGVVNYGIVEYRKSGGKTIDYLRDNGIEYVIDYPCFLSEFKNEMTPIYSVPVKYDPFCENSGPVIYRVNDMRVKNE